ncbi:MAG: hypothetical protein Q7U26_11910, partial [Aquabacterium sp.]|nr:hypothetical protein [Aquabacterium sp.]
KLARHDPAWADEVTRGLAMPEDWHLATLATPDAHGRHQALIDALHGCSAASRELSNHIGRHLFAHVARDRTVWQ